MYKYVFFLLFLAVVFLGLFSCKGMRGPSQHSGVKHPNKTVIVASYRPDCVAVGPQTCYLYKENPEDEWTYFYSEIQGFDYQAGYQYVIKVKVKSLGNSYIDAGDLQFELIEVISKTISEETKSKLFNTWGLLELNGVKIDNLKMVRTPLLDINTQKKIMQGSSGCNSFSASFTYDDKAIKVTFPISHTEDPCTDANIDKEYVEALKKVNRYITNGQDLMLFGDSITLFKFRQMD